jgi:hypothetical protein
LFIKLVHHEDVGISIYSTNTDLGIYRWTTTNRNRCTCSCVCPRGVRGTPCIWYDFLGEKLIPNANMNQITVSMRNPFTWATNTWAHTMALSVLEDTGAAAMKIYPSDQQYLEHLSGCPLPVTSTTNMSTSAGVVPVRSVVVQVNIFHNDQPMLPRWINVRACVGNDPPNSPSSMRLSGVWLHHMLYCLSMPNNTNTMYVGTDVEEILANAPPCNPAYAIPPPVDPTT